MSNVPPVNSSTETGRIGEALAAQYLIDNGFEILRSNYRYKRAEVDIIGTTGNLLVFVEVKFRTSIMYGNPETFVNRSKRNRIKSAAENFIFEINWNKDIRFDVISIVDVKGNVSIEHFLDCN